MYKISQKYKVVRTVEKGKGAFAFTFVKSRMINSISSSSQRQLVSRGNDHNSITFLLNSICLGICLSDCSRQLDIRPRDFPLSTQRRGRSSASAEAKATFSRSRSSRCRRSWHRGRTTSWIQRPRARQKTGTPSTWP